MLVFLILFPCLANNVLGKNRIVNGTDANNSEFPFAAILKANNSLTCGSTILNKKFLLTAAHCVCFEGNRSYSPTFFTVQYGSTKIQNEELNTAKVAKIHCNKYNPISPITNDVAVLELESPLPSDGSWQRVRLAKTFKTSAEQNGIIIGWGRTHEGKISETLQKLNVEIYNDEVCGKKYDNLHHICFGAMNAGACNGDSGTALLIDETQVGIASFITNICGIANKDFPNVYSRVPTYFEWIREVAGDVLFDDLDG